MRKSLCRAGMVLALVIMAAGATRAQLGVGARALSMGGAFTAVAEGDDATSWNPAAVAGQRGHRLLWPSLSLFSNGTETITDAFRGLSSSWSDRLQLVRNLANGPSAFQGDAYVGYAMPGMTWNLQVFGKGIAVPTDGNGTPGRLTLTQNFSLSALHDAAVAQFKAFGTSNAGAENEANKIVAHVQKIYPGASLISVPTFKSRIDGTGDVYGATGMTFGRQVQPDLRFGLTLKMVGAEHITALANFSQKTFTQSAAEVTGGTASPALVDRVLIQLGLKHADGTYFAGNELAGDAAITTQASGLEVRPAADFGGLWRVSKRLQAGMVVRNLVPAHFTSAAPLRTYCDFGTAYVVQPGRLLMSADLTNLLDTSRPQLNLGVEWRAWRQGALRMGLYHNSPTFGFGLVNGVSFAASPGMTLLSFSKGF
ncbi:MAG TPA: hypothetical protein VKU00_02570 [Chthonomonadaceae bacterium]|nr:hypothetical protein [Chthonomonadaceae bacterium]